MSKLTNAEKDKLDNTCGNLRVTKLGTHVKSLEDFVNEGILKTRANDVSNAINELWDMITNKDCESITIPPPGFFTLFGDDQTGKLYVYYNNADYPPQFRHVETPGELEGTLYLYIADPVGENHYELEVGHYIAVKHLDNYYTKEQVRSMFTITVEKQTTAESGSFATYVVKQGGSQVGSKINIPKDYLVKSCSVKTCTTANVPVQGYKVGDKYIDWVINTRDGSASNEHLYLLVNEIVDPYKPDNSTITLSSGNVFSVKDGGITLVKLAPAVQNLINGKADANHAHGNITKEGKVGTTPNVPLITGTDGVVQAGAFGSGANNFARGNHGHSDLASIAYVDNQIASVEGDVVIDLESKADRVHTHGFGDITIGSMGENADFNDYTTQGMFHISYNSAQSATNMPQKHRGLLIVRNLMNGSVSQLFQKSNPSSNEMWYRTYYTDGTWSNWQKMIFDGHTHTKSDLIHYDGRGTDGTEGYVKLLQIKVTSTYANVPISFDIYQRGSSEPNHCALVFASVNSVDPSIESFTYTGNQRNIYIYKETTSTWSIIVQKTEKYDNIHINNVDTGHSYMDSKVTFTALNTHVSTLPSSNITQATFNSVTTAKIADGAVTNAKITSVTDSKITHDSSSYDKLSPVDMSIVDVANANRLAFMPAGNITVQVSTNGGSTFSDYPSITNDIKLAMVSRAPDETTNLYAGGTTTASSNNQIRVILDAGAISNSNSSIYCGGVKKAMVAFTTNGASGTKVKVEMASYATPNNWETVDTYSIGGWWGWNAIPLPNITFGGYSNHGSATDHYRKIRLTFTHTGGSGNPIVKAVRLYAEKSYISPSNFAKTGHIYTYDTGQNVTFPAKIAKNGGTASQVLKANGDVGTIVNDLTTGGTVSVLSAEQGKTLKGLVDGKAPSSHPHGFGDITIGSMGENVDFNSKTEQGMFHISYNSAQSAINMPQKHRGLLIVRNLMNGSVSQLFQKSNTSSNEMWYRTYYADGDTWSDWQKIVFEGHTHNTQYVAKNGNGSINANQNSFTGTIKWKYIDDWLILYMNNVVVPSSATDYVVVNATSNRLPGTTVGGVLYHVTPYFNVSGNATVRVSTTGDIAIKHTAGTRGIIYGSCVIHRPQE